MPRFRLSTNITKPAGRQRGDTGGSSSNGGIL
jgi:hypothetical protein